VVSIDQSVEVSDRVCFPVRQKAFSDPFLISLGKYEIIKIAAEVLNRGVVRILRCGPKLALPIFCGDLPD
jgi:hypothetical protein